MYAINLMSSLSILYTKPLSDMNCKYFLPSGRLPLHSVDHFLCCAEAFRFDLYVISHLVIFAFGVKSEISLPSLISRGLSPMFSSKEF